MVVVLLQKSSQNEKSKSFKRRSTNPHYGWVEGDTTGSTDFKI